MTSEDNKRQRDYLIIDIIGGKKAPGITYLPGTIQIFYMFVDPEKLEKIQNALEQEGWKKQTPTKIGEVWLEPEGGWKPEYTRISIPPSSTPN